MISAEDSQESVESGSILLLDSLRFFEILGDSQDSRLLVLDDSNGEESHFRFVRSDRDASEIVEEILDGQ